MEPGIGAETATGTPARTVLEAALDADMAELARLNRACAALIGADHDLRPMCDRSVTTHTLDRPPSVPDPTALWLADLLEQLADPHRAVPWIDLDGPGEAPNPDAAGLRAMVEQVGRATVIQALANCVAVQRRAVVGTLGGEGADRDWTGYEDPQGPLRYVPMSEPVVEALFHHARLHDNLHLAAEAETLQVAEHWRAVVVPDIERHYRELTPAGAAAPTTVIAPTPSPWDM